MTDPVAANLEAELVAEVARALASRRDPRKAVEMAAYMKTEMPFYGVQKPERLLVLRDIKKRFVPADRCRYESSVLSLWRRAHREEKYLAINYASSFPQFISYESMALYERLIREGAWWDFVDCVCGELVGVVYLKERRLLKPVIEKWAKDADMWIRRASLICQLHHKQNTDQEQLFRFCLMMAGQKEFFIEKAMGWALREYSKTDPASVKEFLKNNRSVLSGLSYREGARHLIQLGLLRS
jgi:3-methyladenine DNA glycosylase AlkD